MSDNATKRDFLTTGQFLVIVFHHILAKRVAHLMQYQRIIVERMSGKIDAHQFFLLIQPIDAAPRLSFGNGGSSESHIVRHAKEGVGGSDFELLVLFSKAHQSVEEHLSFAVGRHILLAHQPKAVESTAQGKTLKRLTVYILQAHSFCEIEDVLKWPVGKPFLHNHIGGAATHAINGR